MHNSRPGIAVLSWAHGHVNLYCNQIKNFEDARLVACWDDDLERGRKNADLHSILLQTDLDEVLTNPEIDCVIIASETNKHVDLCVAAAKAGKSILLQKPM